VDALLPFCDQRTFFGEDLGVDRGGIERGAHMAQGLLVVDVGLGDGLSVLEEDGLDHLPFTVVTCADAVELVIAPVFGAAELVGAFVVFLPTPGAFAMLEVAHDPRQRA
jgi:hypothetical protein